MCCTPLQDGPKVRHSQRRCTYRPPRHILQRNSVPSPVRQRKHYWVGSRSSSRGIFPMKPFMSGVWYFVNWSMTGRTHAVARQLSWWPPPDTNPSPSIFVWSPAMVRLSRLREALAFQHGDSMLQPLAHSWGVAALRARSPPTTYDPAPKGPAAVTCKSATK